MKIELTLIRIIFQLLYDVYNDDHGFIDIYKEWKSLNERPELPYRFNRDYIADTNEGKSIMLGKIIFWKM